MPISRRGLPISIIILLALIGTLHAENLKQIATIPIPGEPMNEFGVVFINQATGLGYLANKSNKSVEVFDTKSNKLLSSISGFVGLTKNGATSGPNGIIAVNEDAELWVSDGDSTIKIVDMKTNIITEKVSTGGKTRANAMAYDPKTRIVIVANPDDEPPFLSLISTKPGHKILANIPIKDASDGLERSVYHAPSSTFYTDVPMLSKDNSKGALAQTDPRTGKLIKLHEIEHCNPHSISIVSESTMFLGCSPTPAGSITPGSELAVFNVTTSKIEAYTAGLGGSGDTAANQKLGLYYHSASNTLGGPALKVIDIKTRKLVQKIPTSKSAHSIGISFTNNLVYLPTTAKYGSCGGCIVVFSAE